MVGHENKEEKASTMPTCISELAHPPLQRDLSFYIVLCLVVPVWSVAPLSWLFVIYTFWTGAAQSFTWFGTLCLAFACLEVVFSIHHFILARRVDGPSTIGSGNLGELQKAFGRVLQSGLATDILGDLDEETLDVSRPGSPNEAIVQLEAHDPRAIDFRNYLRTWFRHVPWSHIHKSDINAWLYWAIFNVSLPEPDALPESHRKVLQEVLEMVEKRAGKTFPEGSNPRSRPLLLNIDPVNVYQRPFVWYAFVTLANVVLKRHFMYHWDMRLGSKDGLDYLLRIPAGWNPKTGPRPIVFLHGLGLGLLQYKMILSRILHNFPDRPLLVPLQPHISQQFWHPNFLRPMNRKETSQVMYELLRELGWAVEERQVTSDSEDEKAAMEMEERREGRKGVTMVSHSNGSYAHAWFLKAFPNSVTRSCFVDPVTFCGWEGHVCYNFLYRPATTGMHLIMRYFVGTELGVANALQRHFDWSSNSLWYEEIPNARDPSKAMFFLGGKDSIINAERVRKYLHSHGVRKGLFFDPDGRHGQALLAGGEGYNRLMSWLAEPSPSPLCAESSSAE